VARIDQADVRRARRDLEIDEGGEPVLEAPSAERGVEAGSEGGERRLLRNTSQEGRLVEIQTSQPTIPGAAVGVACWTMRPA
jgi:hypothetical protein